MSGTVGGAEALILAAARVASFCWDIPARRARVSPEYLVLHGLDPSAPLQFAYGEYRAERVHPDDRATVERSLEEALARGGPFDLVYRIVCMRNGNTRWIHDRGAVLLDDDGRPLRLLSAQSDITERKHAEEALRESEARFRIIANSTPAPVWVTDSRGAVEFGNDAFQEFAGRPAEEMRGEAWINFLHPDDLPQVMEQRRRAWAEGPRAYIYEARFRRADNEWRWLEVHSKPRLGAGGEFLGYVGLATDRTEARQAAEALRESEQRFRLMADNAPVMIWMSDTQGRCIHINRMLREFWDIEESDLAAFDWSNTLHLDDASRVRAAVAEALAAGAGFSIEARYRNAAGEYRVLRTAAHARRSGAGEFLGLIGVNVDVTDFLENQEALRASMQQLDLVTNSLPVLISYVDSDKRYRFVNDEYVRWFGDSRERIVGRHMRDVLGEDTWAIIRERVEAALSGREISYEALLPYRGAGARHVSARYIPHLAASGRVEGFFVLVHDISQRIKTEEALRQSEERLRAIVETAVDAIVVIDERGAVQSLNPAAERTFGYAPEEVEGRNVSMLMPDEHAREHDGYIGAYLDTGVRKIIGIGREVEGRRKDGSLFPLELAIAEWRDALGRRFFTGTMRDITERKRSEALRTLLIDELNHRVKNTLAIVQGLAQQTFRANASTSSARAAFEGRLAALAGAHSLLTCANWESAALGDLADDAFQGCGVDPTRVTLDGPAVIMAPKQALTIAMALHELCTNAVKYGSLSNETGRVELRWRLNSHASSGLHMVWREVGGPPVEEPTRRGFGMRMIEQALTHEFGGDVRLDFRPDGLVCVMDLAAPHGRAAAE